MNRLQTVFRAISTGLLLAATTVFAQQSTDLSNMKMQDFTPPAQFNFATGNIDEAAIGRQLFRRLRQHQPLIEDAELLSYLQSLVQRLTRTNPGLGATLHIAIVNNPEINAYALQGGIILLNSGLIMNTDSESELAAVLAHEIAHISQRHIARMAANQKNSPWLTGLGIIAGAAVASKNPQAGQAIIAGTTAFQAHQQIVYTQDFEAEADRTGLRTLSAAGFSPTALPYFLEKLERRELNTLGSISKYLRSHPLTIERISDTRNRANRIGKKQARESSDYFYARERLRTVFNRNLTTPNRPLPGNVKHYQQALIASQRGNHQRTLQLPGKPSGQLHTTLLMARSLNALRRYAEAERLLRTIHQRYPNHDALTLTLAQALQGQGQSAPALQLLSRIRISDKTSLETIQAAQNLAQQARQQQEALLYNAGYKLLTADYRNAERVLQKIMLASNIQPQLTVRLRHLLNTVRQAKQEQAYLKRR